MPDGTSTAASSRDTVNRALAGQMHTLMSVQEQLFDSYAGLMRGWLDRRHDGFDAARILFDRLARADGMEDSTAAYQDWLNGAMQRMGRDVTAVFDAAAAVTEEAGRTAENAVAAQSRKSG